MKSLMSIAGDRIHARDIRIATYAAGEDSIIVEGTLMDQRLRESYYFTGEKKQPGTIHHMIVRLLLKGRELLIEEVEVEMPCVPREGCEELRESLRPIIGLSISSGFTNEVKRRIGGIKSCYHLMALVLAMAPAAVQGYFSFRALRPMGVENIPREDRLKYIPVDTCRMWRRDGPLVRRVIEELGKL